VKTTFEHDQKRLAVEFPDTEELRKFVEKSKLRDAFWLHLERELQPATEYSIRLWSGAEVVTLRAEVAQVFPRGPDDFATAFEVLATSTVEASDQTSEEPAPAENDAPPEAVTTAKGEMFGSSSALEIRRMNVSQRMRLATRAKRTERQILLRDNSPQVLMGLLANPRIEEKEVVELVKSPYAASGVLQRVAKDRRWVNVYEIRLALVKSPKTPPLLAQRLLPTLNRTDLGALAKSSNVREAVKGAALRLYLKKT
jgi:hypothetical protein